LLRQLFQAWGERLPWLALAAVAGAFAMGRLAGISGWVVAPTLFVSAALLAAAAIAQSALQAERAHWRDCAVTVAGSVARTFAPPLLFVALGGANNALWLGFAFHAAFVALAAGWFFRNTWRQGTRDGATALDIGTAFSGPLFNALAISSWVLAGMNRWIVAAFFGETEAGYFTLAGGAAVVLCATLGAVFVQYFQPGFFALADHAPENRAAVARRVDLVAAGYALVAVAVVTTFAAVAPALVGTWIGEKYRASLPWILPAGCFGTATITTVFYSSLLLAGRRERSCGPVELSTAAVLVFGSVASAAAGAEWLGRWLIATPLVPWLLTRPLARGYFFQPDAAAAPAPGP